MCVRARVRVCVYLITKLILELNVNVSLYLKCQQVGHAGNFLRIPPTPMILA